MPSIAIYVYRCVAKYGYAPAEHHLGVIYTMFDTEYCDVERGKMYIRLAANKGYRPSKEWLEKYEKIDQSTAEILKELMTEMYPSWWRKTRRYFYFFLLLGAVFILVFK